MADKSLIIKQDEETGEVKVTHEGFANDFEVLGWMQMHADNGTIQAKVRAGINQVIKEKNVARDKKAAEAAEA